MPCPLNKKFYSIREGVLVQGEMKFSILTVPYFLKEIYLAFY